MKKISGGGEEKKREGGIWSNHSQTASESILRTSKAHFKFILGTKNLPPLGHFSESDYNMNLIEIVEVKTKLTLQSRECKKIGKRLGEVGWDVGVGVRGLVEAGHMVPPGVCLAC